MLESKYAGPTLLPGLINLQLGFNTWPSRSQDFGNCLLNVSVMDLSKNIQVLKKYEMLKIKISPRGIPRLSA